MPFTQVVTCAKILQKRLENLLESMIVLSILHKFSAICNMRFCFVIRFGEELEKANCQKGVVNLS